MPKLEGVIRPFETIDISPPKIVPPASGTPPDNVVFEVKWGSARTGSGEYSYDIKGYATKVQKEVKDIFQAAHDRGLI